LLRNKMHSTEGLELVVNHPLAALFDQFLKERRFLKNVTEATLVWYRVAFTSYTSAIASDAASGSDEATLQRFVVRLRERGTSVTSTPAPPAPASIPSI
jgi:hypothetical protein